MVLRRQVPGPHGGVGTVGRDLCVVVSVKVAATAPGTTGYQKPVVAPRCAVCKRSFEERRPRQARTVEGSPPGVPRSALPKPAVEAVPATTPHTAAAWAALRSASVMTVSTGHEPPFPATSTLGRHLHPAGSC